ncbi:AAA family ATPase [Candidatus Neptunochlamydia vexilliferae]|nr:AAA family ATPase [Candidatus Neptunochlamydia vexilliferae]
MAIGFGRVEFIKRSEGRNSCQLSAYLSRSRVFFKGNCVLQPKLYDFSHRETISHHEIILPDGADQNLKIPEVLWNFAEKKEARKDAQVSMHLVLALPDDKEITLEDRIVLTRTFIQKHYPGLIAECVIHPPERKITFTEDNEALGIPRGTIGTVIEQKQGNYIVSLPKEIRANPFIEIGTNYPGMSVEEHNWHAHAQLTTRRLKPNGSELEDKKATDLMPIIKKGKVISGPDVGRLWAKHQNTFFLSKGLSLKVDENGLVPQEHLGPARLRGRAFALLEEHEKRLELNAIAASDPQNILKAITNRQSTFTKDDVERFILKHTPADKTPNLIQAFWKQDQLVQLRDKKTQALLPTFTTKAILQEENHILRIADRIEKTPQKQIPPSIQAPFTKNLNKEQIQAYKNILNGKGLSCIQGYAGVGKSYLLKALKDTYEERGLTVRSFGPDNATANVLKEKGFKNAENLYRFLYSHKHGLRELHKGFEIWILDEAGKVGNRPLLELLKLAEKKGAKLILSGDSSQLPPIERGEAFKFFCTRYPTEILQDIQRQKKALSRSIAKDLATGKTGEALDKLSTQGAIHWSLTKKEAIESLILKWANDHRDPPRKSPDSTIIVAHTNAEVRTLNEMVRLVRKQRKEISPQEFQCQVISGSQDKATIFISEGDCIEFRKKDPQLGVRNRDTGILIRAQKNQFTVALQENDRKTRIITFDPQTYRGFQLGYASTAHCVQGRTVDRAYILHSPHLNKQMAYVKLTRHIQEVHYFIPKEEAANLSDLKRQALREGSKSSTYCYTHNEEIEKQASLEKRDSQIQALKSSKELTSRFKGMTLQAWDHLKGKTLGLIQKKQDRSQSSEFFGFRGDGITTSRGTVHEVTKTAHEEPQELPRDAKVLTDSQISKDGGHNPTSSQMPKDSTQIPATSNRGNDLSPLATTLEKPPEAPEKISQEKLLQKISEQDQAIEKNKERVKMQNRTNQLERDLYDQESNPSNSPKSLEKSPSARNDLPKQERKLLSAYFTAASKASELREVVQAECGESLESAPQSIHFQEWQKACSSRNKAAYALRPFLSQEKSNRFLKDTSTYYIETHAKKYENTLKAQEQKALQNEKIKDLNGQLTSHVEPLLYKLFPDGPSSKTAQSYRFGSKGSLSVSHSGPKAGQFYDFERQEGGNLLQLIERELKLDKAEARTWAGEFLGIASEIKVSAQFQKPIGSFEKASDWVSISPDPKVPAPPFEKQKISNYYTEVMRHPYHDQQGNLLYYVTRLQDKKDPSRKITPPLSYGYFKNAPEKLSWQRRGYKPENGKKPLYNLHHLQEKPLAPVLIVEGEKTADKALEKFPDRDFICMTWSGGASSVSKADWSPLVGREVTIWPDNDEAGFKAADQVCQELKKVGAKEIYTIDHPKVFEKLPPKWDLADPLPNGVEAATLNRYLKREDKNRFQQSVLNELERKNKLSLVDKLRAIDLLHTYETANRERFEKDLSQNLSFAEKQGIRFKQTHEGLKFLQKQEEMYKRVTTDPEINASGKLAERLTYQMHLYEAAHGKLPSAREIVTMKNVIQDAAKGLASINTQEASQEIRDLAIDRTLRGMCEKALKGQEVTVDQSGLASDVRSEMDEVTNQKELEIVQNQALQKERAMAKDRSHGLTL